MAPWPKDQSAITFRTSSCIIDVKQITDQYKNAQDLVLRPIKVTVLNIHWLFSKRQDFMKFASMLSGQPSSFYSSKLIENMLEEFWD